MSLGRRVDDLTRKCAKRIGRYRTSIPVRLDGKRGHLFVRKRTTDTEVVWQCFVMKQYDVPMVMGGRPIHRHAVARSYRSIVESGKRPLIVDCGANIGASSVWFKMKYPAASVIAVEPSPDNAEMMRKNFLAFAEIVPLEVGIGPESGTMFLEDDGGGAWGYKTVSHETPTRIQIKTVEDLLNDYASERDVPFILKIDIEGAEQALFEGPLGAISKFPIIIFESHDFFLPGKGTSWPFFKFHCENGRDFLFGAENIFSIKMDALPAWEVKTGESAAAAPATRLPHEGVLMSADRRPQVAVGQR
jgi:FkbM family methyltransferase